MNIKTFMVCAVVLSAAAPAWPCSVVGGRPSAADLVRMATVIVRARADRLADAPGVEGTLGGSTTQVHFTVVDVLKGRLPGRTIEFNGTLFDRNDPNDRPVPYDFIRPGGRGGNCFALSYKPGGEYLLLLRRDKYSAQPKELALLGALDPTNEQLFGGTNDPWFTWAPRHPWLNPTRDPADSASQETGEQEFSRKAS